MSSVNDNASKEAIAIMDKAKRVIDSADVKQKAVVERWLSLMNFRFRREPVTWGLIGGSMGLRDRFIAKFGSFSPRETPVYRGEKGGA